MSSESATAVDVGVIDDPAQAHIVSDRQTARRSDPRERRRWLRSLDLVLADEIRWAGALSCEELIDLAARPLNGRASRETIQEWWEYARRRGWLVAHDADRFQLTDVARADLQARHESTSAPNPTEWAKALVKWALPAGAIGAIGYSTGRRATTIVTAVLVCLLIALWLLVLALIIRLIDHPTDRYVARRACDWLDGRCVPLSLTFRSDVRKQVTRLYGLSSSDRDRAIKS